MGRSRLVFRKSFISFLIISFLISSCSPKLRSSITNSQPEFSNNEYVLVLPLLDEQIIDGIKVGSIKSTDGGLSTNCSYPEVIALLKSISRTNGANVIKITAHKFPGGSSTCDRIVADIYRVENVSIYERVIEWRKERKLTWNDFKGSVREGADKRFKAETYCDLSFRSNRVNLYNKVTFFVSNNFICNLSWVKPEGKISQQLLAHEQAHFDLAEIYAKRLRKKFKTTNSKLANFETEAKSIFEKIQKELNEKQETYDRQTNHGTIPEKQKEWESYISLTLSL